MKDEGRKRPKGKKSRVIDFRLYLITDGKLVNRQSSIVIAVRHALKAGVKAVQLREKDLGSRKLLKLAYTMRDLTKKYNARLFINDRVDIALAVRADGVHLTQNSIPAYAVRKAVKKKLLIGVSTHSLKEAREAEKAKADFITFGPVYRTPSKLKYGKPVGINKLRSVCRTVKIPVFAIGGVKDRKIEELKRSGAHGAAMISEIFGAEDIKKKSKKIINLMGKK